MAGRGPTLIAILASALASVAGHREHRRRIEYGYSCREVRARGGEEQLEDTSAVPSTSRTQASPQIDLFFPIFTTDLLVKSKLPRAFIIIFF